MKKFKANNEYFKYPKNKFLNNIILSKFDFSEIELSSKKPCIYLSPKTSHIDENLISKCIKNKFVFLKNEIVSTISLGQLSQNKQDEILKEINILTENNFSISILFGSNETIFGENEKLSERFVEFLRNTKLDIKFLTFPGEYFALPIWADKPRKSKIFSSQQVTIKQRYLDGLNKKEIVSTINNSIPSSASTYLSKYPISINSNNLAEGLERYMYCCPHCKNILSIYSEFSCIKCRDCGSVIEFSSDGKILFSKNISNFDNIEDYQFKCLTKKGFTIKPLIQYDKITQIIRESCKKTIKFVVILQVYAEKLIIQNAITNKKTTLNFEDIENIDYFKNNTVSIKTKNAKEFCFFGNSNENFFIIRDLVKLNKN